VSFSRVTLSYTLRVRVIEPTSAFVLAFDFSTQRFLSAPFSCSLSCQPRLLALVVATHLSLLLSIMAAVKIGLVTLLLIGMFHTPMPRCALGSVIHCCFVCLFTTCLVEEEGGCTCQQHNNNHRPPPPPPSLLYWIQHHLHNACVICYLINQLMLVVVCLWLGMTCASSIAFTGTWTDTRRFGGDMFLCTPDGTTLYGSYSNYGVMIGTLKNFRTVSGFWYVVH
jgi:hypothetical protein